MNAAKTREDLRVAEVTKLDLRIEEGKILYRARVSLSFKVHSLVKYAESFAAKLYTEEVD